MIYLEVTTSSKSVRNTGIQRITRRIFQELAARVSLTPISWNKVGRRFHRLSRAERAILQTPFLGRSRPTTHPELRGENFMVDAYRTLFRKNLQLTDALQEGDVFLIPDIYRDARTRILPALNRKIRGKSAAIFHDAAALQLPSLYPRAGPRRRFREYIESLASFDLVICVSGHSHDELQRLWAQYGTKPTRTAVETWPVEFSEEERIQEQKPLGNLVVCVGSLEPRKNHLLLLRAAKSLWDRGLSFDLTIIGRSTVGHGWNVSKQIRTLQGKGYSVRWLRHVDDRVLHRAYRDCKFTVYPSLVEGFGLPIAESLWHGKPCICGGNGALGEVAQGGGCLIVDQDRAEALADGMAELLTNPSRYEKLCEEARERRFRSWSDYADRLLAHLGSLFGSGSAPQA